MKTEIEERVLHFLQPAGTSRGVYTERHIWLVRIIDGEREGVGECAPLPQLSCDDIQDYTYRLHQLCKEIESCGCIDMAVARHYPSMLFGLETAMIRLHHGERMYDTPFTRGEEGIPINGLVWMGSYEEMSERIEQKLSQGFDCVKLKIGAIDFDAELSLLKMIRSRYSRKYIQLRVDANGAFCPDDAMKKLNQLSRYDLHSIEQPIRAGQWQQMSWLCRNSPVPIALDEELIGANDSETRRELLREIRPSYIVLKPSLHGGISGCNDWISQSKGLGIESWITSALESNIGLSAIAQYCSWVYGSGFSMPQGLGTGVLYSDNTPSTTEVRGNKLWYVE